MVLQASAMPKKPADNIATFCTLLRPGLSLLDECSSESCMLGLLVATGQSGQTASPGRAFRKANTFLPQQTPFRQFVRHRYYFESSVHKRVTTLLQLHQSETSPLIKTFSSSSAP